MINNIQFPQDTHFLKPISIVATGVLLHELVTYPLDRLATRAIANQSGGHFQDILVKEGSKGLFKGLSIGIDRVMIQHISMYFAFQYCFNRYGLDFKERCDIKPYEQPYMKYCEGIKFYGIAFGASVLSTIFSQTSNIVKMKVQCEAIVKKRMLSHLDEIMGYHKNSLAIGMSPGFRSRVLLNFGQLVSEIHLFQSLVDQEGYLFMNRLPRNTKEAKGFPLIPAIVSSLVVPTLFHPFYYLQKRYTMRKLQNLPKLSLIQMLRYDGEGWQQISRGFGSHLVRYSSRSMLLFYFIWNGAQ